MLVFRAVLKILNACENSKQGRPGQTDLGLLCLSRTFRQTTSIQNLRTFIMPTGLYVNILTY